MTTFRRCLDSALRQSSKCGEIIVVDRFSHDGLASYAEANGATVIQSVANRSEARNIGLQNASSTGVLFVDADMILPTTLIEECESGLDEHDALIIPEESVGVGFWAECKVAERRFYVGDDRMEAARCFRKSALLQLRGYNPELEAGEDWDLQSRVVARHLSVGRVTPVILHDEGQLSLSVIIKKKYLYGKTFAKYMRGNMTTGVRQINPLRIIVPGFKVLPSSPKLATGMMVMKSLEFASVGFGHLVGRD
jgi:glycosyltransferase involved in cell wall biosynthesis